MQPEGTKLRVIYAAHEVTDHMLVLVVNCIEDNYPYFCRLGTDEFIDELCKGYLNAEGVDIQKLDSPAVRKVMRHARRALVEARLS